MVKISIITVCLNSKKTIESTIQSVINQSYSNIEYIVIDGGSTDGTTDIVNQYKSSITAFISEPDQGIYDAMNKGIALAQGDIIGLLNSDDIYTNNRTIEDVVYTFEKNKNIDACYSDLVYINENNQVIRYWKSNAFKPGSFAYGWTPPHPTFFVKREAYAKYGVFSKEYKIAADVELMMRFIEIYEIKAKYVESIWVKMKTGGISNSSIKNIAKQNIEIIYALKKHKLNVSFIMFIFKKISSRIFQYIKNDHLDLTSLNEKQS